MTSPAIINAIVAVFLLAAVLLGARRGLLKSLAGLAMVLAALVGAGVLSSLLTEPVSRAAEPLIRDRISQRVEETMALQEAEPSGESGFLTDLLTGLGWDGELGGTLAQEVGKSVRETGASLVSAVVMSLVESVVRGVLFLAAFASLLLILHLAAGTLGLLVKLPGLRTLNALGGGALGLLEGALLAFLAVWVLRRLGVAFDVPPLADAQLLRIFTANTPLGLLSFLQ